MNECLYLMSADFSCVGGSYAHFCYSHDRNFQGLGDLLLEQLILGCGVIFIKYLSEKYLSSLKHFCI